MNILVSENLDMRGAALAQALADLGHAVTVLRPGPCALEGAFELLPKSPAALTAEDLRDTDAVLCLPAPEKADDVGVLAERILASGQRVPLVLVEECPLKTGGVPRTAAAALLQAYMRDAGLAGCQLSLPAIYGDSFLPPALETIVESRARTNMLTFRGAEDEPCDALHVSDAAALLSLLLGQTEVLPEALAVRSGNSFTLGSVAGAFRTFYAQSELVWETDASAPAADTRGDRVTPVGWQPAHSLLTELPGILREVNARYALQRDSRKTLRLSAGMKTLLFLLAFGAVWAYAYFTHTHSALQFVDMRLLFVIAVSVVMDRPWNLLAALLAGGSAIMDQLLSGTAWHILLYRPSNWIPLAVYLACAILFGMYRENHLKAPEDAREGDPPC